MASGGDGAIRTGGAGSSDGATETPEPRLARRQRREQGTVGAQPATNNERAISVPPRGPVCF